MKKILAFISLLFLMVACSSTEDVKSSGNRNINRGSNISRSQTTIRNIGKFQVDSNSYVATGKNERVQFIILHYTATDNLGSIKELTSSRVSSHFLVLDEDDNKIYNLVPLEQRAWHAGASAFRGRTNINDTSVAPSRKKDPGAKFPWKELYDKYNIGAWYDEADKQEFMDEEKFNATSIREIKDELRKYGYEINRFDEWDKESKDVVYAFQLHFNPKNPTGEMDLETFAILKALNKKYPE